MDDSSSPRCSPYVEVSPLWSRAPARDHQGKPYSDFLMLIPGLKKENDAGIESCLLKIRESLAAYENVVVYVDLNIKLGLLWVSIKPVPGITRQLVHAIQQRIPHAKVVASDFNPEPMSEKRVTENWLSIFRRRVNRQFRLISAKAQRLKKL